MLTSAAAASSLIPLGSSHCHTCHREGVSCAVNGATTSWFKQPFDFQRVSDHSGVSFRRENSLFGSTHFQWLSVGQESRLISVSVAADYSDSVPDSSNVIGNKGYHPLEELRKCRRVRNTKLTDAEIARTTLEANNTALLIFPGVVHCEPHEQNSWAEFLYLIDEYGDIYFLIYDDVNILEDREASNPVNALIAMDMPEYENRRIDTSEYSIFESDFGDNIAQASHYFDFEVEDLETSDARVDWGMPDSSNWVHPIYFSKCLSKVVTSSLLI